MALLFEKSRTWRRIVAVSKASPAFFAGFTAVTIGASGLLWYVTQKATERNTEEFREELLKRGRKDAVMVNTANKERLGQLLKEIREKDNFEDRYKAALKGETLTGTPEARVRGGSGSSATPEWVAKAIEAQAKGAAPVTSSPVRKQRAKAEDSSSQETVKASERGQKRAGVKIAVSTKGPERLAQEKEESRRSSWWNWGKSTV